QGENAQRLRAHGGRVLLLTDARVCEVTREGALVTLLASGVGGMELVWDGAAFAVRDRKLDAIVVGSVFFRAARFPTAFHLWGGRLAIDAGDTTLLVPLDALAKEGEVRARVLEIVLDAPPLEEAIVIDNPHNTLRFRNAKKPLVEARTGPLGLSKGDTIRVGFVDGRIATLLTK